MLERSLRPHHLGVFLCFHLTVYLRPLVTSHMCLRFSFLSFSIQIRFLRPKSKSIVGKKNCQPVNVWSYPTRCRIQTSTNHSYTTEHDQVSNFISWYCAEGARRRQSFSVSSQNNSGARPADHCKIVQLLPRQKWAYGHGTKGRDTYAARARGKEGWRRLNGEYNV